MAEIKTIRHIGKEQPRGQSNKVPKLTGPGQTIRKKIIAAANFGSSPAKEHKKKILSERR
ncbi:MAG: hypothetical protein D9V46_03850 [Deltaproteobacteria bacterium]|uniref:hypothetical protein n=1 Tax=Hydrosulfovibrio ferrireducens TaxID=2934181 RepID=UPI001222207A|nr:MAG: hypothetical protein D9V46_03720 [Deltaproteobacteria bacterium]TDB38453.1 MAG: hypothetical protein D9V46_03850 [Deltaproteobacteria bacterium]